MQKTLLRVISNDSISLFRYYFSALMSFLDNGSLLLVRKTSMRPSHIFVTSMTTTIEESLQKM